MTPQQREVMLDKADAFGAARDRWAEILDALTERGFSISLASVRDHTVCERCSGDGELTQWFTDKRYRMIPCPGGSPVVWSAD